LIHFPDLTPKYNYVKPLLHVWSELENSVMVYWRQSDIDRLVLGSCFHLRVSRWDGRDYLQYHGLYAC